MLYTVSNISGYMSDVKKTLIIAITMQIFFKFVYTFLFETHTHTHTHTPVCICGV